MRTEGDLAQSLLHAATPINNNEEDPLDRQVRASAPVLSIVVPSTVLELTLLYQGDGIQRAKNIIDNQSGCALEEATFLQEWFGITLKHPNVALPPTVCSLLHEILNKYQTSDHAVVTFKQVYDEFFKDIARYQWRVRAMCLLRAGLPLGVLSFSANCAWFFWWCVVSCFNVSNGCHAISFVKNALIFMAFLVVALIAGVVGISRLEKPNPALVIHIENPFQPGEDKPILAAAALMKAHIRVETLAHSLNPGFVATPVPEVLTPRV